ncbi:(Lyso)-N-acylphosphatidylethanolamine lipase isoform X2 [Aethina tumida]|nr:(Lyso)-N-acylphosphatidylethanolamine lipase isoform X2 [Aethina tumida]XP_019881711.1 (Lyso)-N-acylphosphatidylethanolamine lipase isoform X2 [Aethina tumida]
MSKDNSYKDRYSWIKFSEAKLISIEKRILEVVKTAYKGWFVPVQTVSDEDKIWTVSLNPESKNTPLLLLHGFAAGLGFWCLNFDAFAKDRPVYAIDLLGFGRSSRPTFSSDNTEAEKQLVESIEQWRKSVNLDKFIILGHSFGGYLATSYSIQHPEHVKHLILADPWGFNIKPDNFNPPLWLKTLAFFLYPFTQFNPLATVRAAGPIGPWLIKKTRADISEKYAESLDDKDLITEYIYQCNSQKPTGESAFHSMMKGFGWAKNPMIDRIQDLDKNIPMTILYGEYSWIDKSSGAIIQDKRPTSYVDLKIVPGAGHHINADQPEIFNNLVVETCNLSDAKEDQPKKVEDSKKNAENSDGVNVDLALN